MSTQDDRSPTPPSPPGTPNDASPTPSTPFDPDTLPSHLRAKLDRISGIRWRMLESIALHEEQDAAGAEAEAARAAQQNNEAAGAADSQRSATRPARGMPV